jgi:hypothetical protein
MDLPPLMRTTPGITEKRFSADPLGTEGELTDGPDDVNPFRSAEEREIVLAYRAKQKEQEETDIDAMASDGPTLPFAKPMKEDPTEDPDPFVFDDVGEQIGELRLPFADSDGPNF